MSVKTNVGFIDRILRLGISGILFYLGLFFHEATSIQHDPLTGYTLVAVAVINTVVALVGICPIYMLIGIKTVKSE